MTTFDLDSTARLTKMTLDKFAEKVNKAANADAGDEQQQAVKDAVNLAIAAFSDLAVAIIRTSHAVERLADATEISAKALTANVEAIVADAVAENLGTVHEMAAKEIKEELKRKPLGTEWDS